MRFILRHLVFSAVERTTLSGVSYEWTRARLFGVPIPNRFGEWLARFLVSIERVRPE